MFVFLVKLLYLGRVASALGLEVQVAFPEAAVLGVHDQVMLRDLPLVVRELGEYFQLLILHLADRDTLDMVILMGWYVYACFISKNYEHSNKVRPLNNLIKGTFQGVFERGLYQ